MPAIALNDIFEVTWEQRLADQTILTFFHYKVTGVGAGPEVSEFSELLAVQQQEAGGPLEDVYEQSSNELSLVSTRAQDVHPIRYAYREVFPPAAVTGDIAEPALPPGVAICITKQGPLAGRHQHGQIHMAGAPNTFIEQGLLSAAALADLIVAWSFLPLVLNIGGVELTPVIFNRAVPGSSVIFDHYTVETQARTMSRRVVGRGI